MIDTTPGMTFISLLETTGVLLLLYLNSCLLLLHLTCILLPGYSKITGSWLKIIDWTLIKV